jgi:hypothetical protein
VTLLGRVVQTKVIGTRYVLVAFMVNAADPFAGIVTADCAVIVTCGGTQDDVYWTAGARRFAKLLLLTSCTYN